MKNKVKLNQKYQILKMKVNKNKVIVIKNKKKNQ